MARKQKPINKEIKVSSKEAKPLSAEPIKAMDAGLGIYRSDLIEWIKTATNQEIQLLERDIADEKKNRLMSMTTPKDIIHSILFDNKTQDKGVHAVIRGSEIKGTYRGREGERHGIRNEQGNMVFFRESEVNYLNVI